MIIVVVCEFITLSVCVWVCEGYCPVAYSYLYCPTHCRMIFIVRCRAISSNPMSSNPISSNKMCTCPILFKIKKRSFYGYYMDKTT